MIGIHGEPSSGPSLICMHISPEARALLNAGGVALLGVRWGGGGAALGCSVCGEVGVALLDVRRVGAQGVVAHGNWIVRV